MEGGDFLNDTSVSKTPRSPRQASTATKENKNRLESCGKLNFTVASDSVLDDASPVDYALNEHTNTPSTMHEEPILSLDLDFLSQTSVTTSSSLGILSLNSSADFTDASIVRQTVKSKKKRATKNVQDASTPSSSDVEFDDEKALEFDDYFKTVEARMSEIISKNISEESILARACETSLFGKLTKSMNASAQVESPELHYSAGGTEVSTFLPEKLHLQSFVKFSDTQGTSLSITPKQNPWLDVSSFHANSLYGAKSDEATPTALHPSEMKLTDSKQNVVTSFCDEGISARSSSFGSSKDSPGMKTLTPKPSSPKTDEESGDEVLAGSIKQISISAHQNIFKTPVQTKDSDKFVEDVDVENTQYYADLAFYSDLPVADSPEKFDFKTASLQLGLTEDDFFSKEAAMQMLKEHEEPYIGKDVTTPPHDSSTYSLNSDESDKMSAFGSSNIQSSTEVNSSINTLVRASSVQRLVEEMPLNQSDDAVKVASDILEKFLPKTSFIPRTYTFQYRSGICKRKENSSLLKEQDLVDRSESPRHISRSISSSNIAQNSDISREISDAQSSSSISVIRTVSLQNISSLSDEALSETDGSGKITKCSSYNKLPSNRATPLFFTRPISQCSNMHCNARMYHSHQQQPIHELCPHCVSQAQAKADLSDGAKSGLTSTDTLNMAAPFSFQDYPLVLPMQNPGAAPIKPIIQIPDDELVFPEIVTIGDKQQMILAVQNSSFVPCNLNVSLASVILDGKYMLVDASGLSFPNNTLIGNGTANIQILLSPKLGGQTEVQLKVVPTFMTPDHFFHTVNDAIKVKIKYEAEEPHVTFLKSDKDIIDMGSVEIGTTILGQVTLTNKGNATVPLKIKICEETQEGCFRFAIEEMNLQKGNVKSHHRFISSKVMTYRLPKQPNDELSGVKIPIVFEAAQTCGRSSCSIIAEIDNPELSNIVALVRVFVTTGSRRVVFKNPIQETCMLDESEIECDSHISIPVDDDTTLMSTFMERDKFFSVSPLRDHTCEVNSRPSRAPTHATRVGSKMELYVDRDTVEFPCATVGESAVQYIKVINATEHTLKVSVIRPDAPFNVTHSSTILQSSKSRKLPIYFKPLKPFEYCGTFSLHSNAGHVIDVHLKGSAEQ